MTPVGWPTVEAGARAALEQAVLAWRSGGLPCGASIVDGDGTVLVVGRNRAYDEPTGTSPLEGNPLAHAELNALAQLPTDRDLTEDTLWSTQRPCSMCEAAIRFCGVGATHYLAEDPSDIGPGGPSDMTEWGLLANAVFLQPFIARGLEDTLDQNRSAEPETVRFAMALASGTLPQDLDGLLESLPVEVTGLVEERDLRLETAGS